jgi:methylenetetrahydrofolate dehydrogenase (NADP+)/methenyltetrahydrofolate cyclohydrolase
MTATILNGRELAKELRDEIRREGLAFSERHNTVPTLAVVRAGDDAASVSYARSLEKSFGAVGFGFQLQILPETAPQAEISAKITQLNADAAVQGIMVQEPLPKGIDEAAIKAVLAPDKDVDGVHPLNTGRLAQAAPVGRPAGVDPFFVPATPAGGLELLKRYNIELQGKLTVVVGRSTIVGKPMALLLLRENATVVNCHSRTQDLPAVCRKADILCAAVGRPRMIKGHWIKPDAVVIDFGINFLDGEMCGDVEYEEAVAVAGMITPVPGGTGPMTNVMLMQNVFAAARRQVEKTDAQRS